MAERQDPARDAEAAEYLPLARAAALAHDRLFPGQRVKDAKTLDLFALALSMVVPLYQRDMKTGALHALTQEEIGAGRFTRGATRLEFADRPTLRFLVVSRRELYPAIETIAKDPTCPILRLSRPQSHPRPPAYSSGKGA
ncbi:MAG TPA: hypothetical protein VFB93_08965 [Burkholderiales bacterium]|nr:hypothetical protein [Burkholderiales bacterium]